MALRFDSKYIFYHIPKTGGNYVRVIIYKVCSTKQEIGNTHNSPLDIHLYKKLTSFTVVRNPLDWYKSFYRYRRMHGWRKNHYIDQHAEAYSFEEFINKMVKTFPHGFLTCKYLGVIPFVDHVLRTETLTKKLKDLLEGWGYEFPTEIDRLNVTERNIDTSLSPTAQHALTKAESRIIKYLGY